MAACRSYVTESVLIPRGLRTSRSVWGAKSTPTKSMPYGAGAKLSSHGSIPSRVVYTVPESYMSLGNYLIVCE